MYFDRQQLETFSVVLQTGSFREAARVLNLTKSAVFQRINSLEEHVGALLLVREGVTPTPSGEMLLHHIQALKTLEADTIGRIKPDASSRTKVAIAVNADSLATWFGPVACAIAKENVSLELIVDDQDHTLAVLARGEAMGCVSTAHTAPTGFVAEPIGAMEYECVATPSFAQSNFMQGLNLRDILAVPAVLFNRKDGLHATFITQLLGFPINGYPVHYFPSPQALLFAIHSGIGYGLVPAMQVQPLIVSGDLVALAPRNKISVDLYWHHWLKAPPNAQTISDVVMRQARQALIQPPSASPAQLDGSAVDD
ncbi:HTH-type transcriptional regulator ArgP [Paraburkholderia terricola]|uniref:LysR family transcriptional regulator, chromosome initiation inhibitor n=1 Tax=Paraburkholderia terricola TaxID=169427 RepID=A0A1M6J2L3_9BURK|nr:MULTISPECIES: HTH-type transcriptional regulator ArgP [Paraburkholderia]SDN48615.1 LysR family transcriptional regulator, chromosome initiation inhibitor [Paraburkholderia sediminicola]SHJ40811.1 LysR family transcriptional regulator, chromosome initiation inhibitor [Paraburkholderia terricola]